MGVPVLPTHFDVEVADPINELDEVSGKISNLLMPHRMQFVDQRRPINISIRTAHLLNSSISYFNYRAATIIEIEALEDHYIVEIPLSGVANTWLGTQSIASRKGMAAIISPGANFRTQWTADCTKLLCLIERKALERELSHMLDESIRHPVRFQLGLALDKAHGRALWRAVCYILKELELYADAPTINVHVSKKLEQLLIWSLLLSQDHNYSPKVREGTPCSEPVHVRTAEEYMKENCREHLGIDDLAKIAGVSPRSLFAGFRKHKGISPLNYLMNLRYEGVHAALMNSHEGRTVSDIALEWGFDQLGRFSVEYKRRYGESPSDTLKRRSAT